MTLEEQARRARADIRIATVYTGDSSAEFSPVQMSHTRWLRMSEALARLGYRVDMIVNDARGIVEKTPFLRYVTRELVDWGKYDVVKTLFHKGFRHLCEEGGSDHGFIISKLGSVVGHVDGVEGVHFVAREREHLYEVQRRVSQRSRYVTLLTRPSRLLWEREFGTDNGILIVPTGVDETVPSPSVNPYREFSEKIAVYIGTIYSNAQREVNVLWQRRLNSLGRSLKQRGIRLCFVGPGNTERLDPHVVTCVGPIGNDRIWDYQYFADVGLALAQGRSQHNESSKIYYYLRTGLPVVSEVPIPNNHLIRETALGFVSEYADDQMMSEMIEAAAHGRWEKEAAIRYMLEHHTWDKRARVYDDVIRKDLWQG
jgi:hypothetical protein